MKKEIVVINPETYYTEPGECRYCGRDNSTFTVDSYLADEYGAEDWCYMCDDCYYLAALNRIGGRR